MFGTAEQMTITQKRYPKIKNMWLHPLVYGDQYHVALLTSPVDHKSKIELLQPPVVSQQPINKAKA
jgi:hypothetical protein